MRTPIVIPVFGQGRALYALAGDGIKVETIDRAATFLIGKCSCEVKEQNPGVDLLLAADWKGIVATQAAGIPDLPTMAELTRTAPVTVTITPPAAPSAVPPASEKSTPIPRPWLLAIGILLLLLAARALRRRTVA